MTDYTEFDKLLVEKIKSGAGDFTALRGGKLESLGNSISASSSCGDPQGWRVIDRRLQALRKNGALTYDRRNGWRVVALPVEQRDAG